MGEDIRTEIFCEASNPNPPSIIFKDETVPAEEMVAVIIPEFVSCEETTYSLVDPTPITELVFVVNEKIVEFNEFLRIQFTPLTELATTPFVPAAIKTLSLCVTLKKFSVVFKVSVIQGPVSKVEKPTVPEFPTIIYLF